MKTAAIPAIAALAAAALTAGGAAQAATCACATPHHHQARHLTPARYRPYYAPEFRAHRIAYAPLGRVYYEPEFVPGPPPPPPVWIDEPVAYGPPPPPPVTYIGGPGYRAVDAAYVGPDPDWRRPIRGHRRAPICRRP